MNNTKTRKATGGEIEVFEFIDELKEEWQINGNEDSKNMLDNLAHEIENELGYVRSEAMRLHRLWVKNVFNNPDVDYNNIID